MQSAVITLSQHQMNEFVKIKTFSYFFKHIFVIDVFMLMIVFMNLAETASDRTH